MWFYAQEVHLANALQLVSSRAYTFHLPTLVAAPFHGVGR